MSSKKRKPASHWLGMARAARARADRLIVPEARALIRQVAQKYEVMATIVAKQERSARAARNA